MTAGKLISSVIPPLRTSDTVRMALERMSEFKLYHLPIVNEKQFLGLVSEDDLVEAGNSETAIGALPLHLMNAFCYDTAHVYELIRLFGDLRLSVVPVLDQHKNYLGVVEIKNMMEYISHLFAVNEPGAVIVLSISNRNNSLAHISQVVEIENAQILSSYVNTFANSTRMEVTLKVNIMDVSAIVASFERYDYEVVAVFNNSGADNNYMDRYDSFMNYLNV